MRCFALLRYACFLVLVLALSPVLLHDRARAGEVSVYLKSGWFTWDEQLDGAPFVQEKGALHGAGIARSDLLGRFSVGETVELWGGNVDYDGHDLTGSAPVESDTNYLGTREEVALGVRIPASWLTLEPLVAAGHRFWVRTRSGEDWNTIYGKAGLAAEARAGAASLFLKGGALRPFFTRNHVSLSNAGYSDVVTSPEGEWSAFAEGGVRVGACAVSVEYEGLRFGRSDRVPTTRRTGPSGTVIVNSQAFQPQSRSDLISLKLAWIF